MEVDVLVVVGKPLLHERIDVAELDVSCSFKMPVLNVIRAQNNVDSALIVLMWWTLPEVLQDDALEVDVRSHDWCREEVVHVQDVH